MTITNEILSWGLHIVIFFVMLTTSVFSFIIFSQYFIKPQKWALLWIYCVSFKFETVFMRHRFISAWTRSEHLTWVEIISVSRQVVKQVRKLKILSNCLRRVPILGIRWPAVSSKDKKTWNLGHRKG